MRNTIKETAELLQFTVLNVTGIVRGVFEFKKTALRTKQQNRIVIKKMKPLYNFTLDWK